ncbi:MAG: type IV pilin protein [Acidimicrobiia bacterium]
MSGAGKPRPGLVLGDLRWTHADPHNLTTGDFTMIELLMVVTIIGILMAIAIPTFLGTRRGANDRAAQTLVRNLLVSARAADNGAVADAATIQANEPTLHVVAHDTEGSASHSEVSVLVDQVGGRSFAILASRSTSGRCFAVLEPEDGATRYQAVDSGACTADSFDPASGWSDQWP